MPLARNTFLSLAGVLLGVGLLMVYSSSITARPTEFEEVYLGRHVAFLGFALVCGVLPMAIAVEMAVVAGMGSMYIGPQLDWEIDETPHFAEECALWSAAMPLDSPGSSSQ